MSWDVMLIKTADVSAGTSADSGAGFDLRKVRSALQSRFEGIDCSDDRWVTYENAQFSISFNLDEDEIILHIHILDEPEDAVLSVIQELCGLLGCEAIDTVTGRYLKK